MSRYKYYLIGIVIIVIGIVSYVGYLSLYQEEEIIPEIEEPVVIVPEKLYVDVKGAVKKPDVYEFENGARVIDAINKAGGLTKNGNTSNINLSQKLIEEMVVYVFSNTEIKKGSDKITCDTTCQCTTIKIDGEEASGKVNINTATQSELMALPGIGESKAKAIIDYRNHNGLFKELTDLMKVSGIGQSTYDNLKELITI